MNNPLLNEKDVQRKTKKENPKAFEVLERKANQENIKALKPEECLKFLSCYIDHSILQLFTEETFLGKLSVESECNFEVRYYNRSVIRWERKVVEYFANSETMAVETKSNRAISEPDMLVVLHADQLVPLVHAYNNYDEGITLSQWAASLQSVYQSSRMHLVCTGLKKYLSKVKSKNQKAFKDGILQEDNTLLNQPVKSNSKSKKKKNLLIVSSEAIEHAFVDLQEHTNIDVICVDDEDDLITLIQQFTKSVGEAPYKRLKRGNVSFVNDASSVKVHWNSACFSKCWIRPILLTL